MYSKYLDDLHTTIRCRVGAKGYTLKQVEKLKEIATYNQGNDL